MYDRDGFYVIANEMAQRLGALFKSPKLSRYAEADCELTRKFYNLRSMDSNFSLDEFGLIHLENMRQNAIDLTQIKVSRSKVRVLLKK
jgi:hypothetical protein